VIPQQQFLAGIANFLAHFFLSDIVAESIGWKAGSPFQLEVPLRTWPWACLESLQLVDAMVTAKLPSSRIDIRLWHYTGPLYRYRGHSQPGPWKHNPECGKPAQARAAHWLPCSKSTGRSIAPF
jgi:hypothetical protein